MATNNQIKFYKVQTLPSTFVTGAVYFEVSTQRIAVAKSTTECDYFGVGLKSAVLENGILTITRHDNTKVTVDLNDIASASSVQAALNGIKAQINTINGNESTEGSIAYAVKAEADRAKAAEKKLGEDFAAADAAAAEAAAEEYEAIRGEISAAQTTLQGNIDAKADKATTYTKDEVADLLSPKANAADVYTKGEVDTTVNGINAAISAMESAYKAADQGLQDQIDALVTGTVKVDEKSGDKYVEVTYDSANFTYTVASKGIDDAIAVETAAREAAVSGVQSNLDTVSGKVNTLIGSDVNMSARDIVKAEVLAQLDSEKISDSFDTLTEMAEWLSSHPQDVTDMNGLISANAAAIEAEKTAREAADTKHTNDIAALVEADAAQDALIAAAATKDELSGAQQTLNAAIQGNTTAIKTINDTTIPEINSRIDTIVKTTVPGLEAAINGKVAQGDFDTLSGTVGGHTAAISGINTEIDNLEAATGFEGVYSANNSANYIKNATSLKDADDKLDAAIKSVADSVANKNVAAEGDTYVTATASGNKVTVAAVTGTVESKTGLATNQGVFDALCWVEFN